MAILAGIYLRGGSYERRFLFNQIGLLTRSGYSLAEGLKRLAIDLKSKALRGAVLALAHEVENGRPLSQAMRLNPRIFQPHLIAVVEAGEQSGRLTESMQALADWEDPAYDLDFRGLLFYPLSLMVFSSLFVMFLMVKVVPTFSDVFESFGSDLPALTRVVLYLSEFSQVAFWPFLIFAVAGGAFFYFRFRHRPWPYLNALIRLPFFGEILRSRSLGLFSSLLKNLLSAGVPLGQALRLAAGAAGPYEGGALDLASRVDSGEPMGAAAKSLGVFPPAFVWHLDSGFSTGRLADALQDFSMYYQGRLKRSVAILKAAFGPGMILAVGLVVAVIIIAMFMPMFSLGEAV